MTTENASWLVIALGLIGANLPFFNSRLLCLFPASAKSLWVRLAELLVWYGIVGACGFAFEGALGNRFSQGWQFYAITLCLFLVFAFPGFVWRYLLRRQVIKRPETEALMQREPQHGG